MVLDVREYIDTAGRSPFTKWLRALNVQAAAKVATALERIAAATCPTSKRWAAEFSNTRSISAGYRIYFGRDGGRLVILLAGGTKQRQREDIRPAQANWKDYLHRKSKE